MRYWWVNHNQTYRHEVQGNYLWSPKRKANQAQNPFYDFMREVTPGDIVFSFSNTQIRAIGIAATHAYEAPKPLEFGQAGAYWNNIGWRVDVRFHELRRPARPGDHMPVLAPLLPSKYAPLRANGAGLQSVYLTRLPEEFAAALIDLLGAEAHGLVRGLHVGDEQPAYVSSGDGLPYHRRYSRGTLASQSLQAMAGLGYLWFVTLHPFDDGNGRIARAVGDLLLTRADRSPQRFYSLSAQMQRERKVYYDILERTQKGDMDVTAWLIWFLAALLKAVEQAHTTLDQVLAKARFWKWASAIPMNERQIKVLNRLLDGFEGKLTTGKWAAIAKCSQDTALRDITELLKHEVLQKTSAGGRSTSYELRSTGC